MTTMQFEVFEAFRSLGVAEDKASAAAQALARGDPDIATLKSGLAAVKGDVNAIKDRRRCPEMGHGHCRCRHLQPDIQSVYSLGRSAHVRLRAVRKFRIWKALAA